MATTEPTPFEQRSDDELLDQLRRAGFEVPEGLAQAIVRRGERMVAPLSEMMLDTEGWESNDVARALASVHAFYLLGAIGSPAAATPLLELLRLDPGWDFLTEDGPAVLSRLGSGAFEPLAAFAHDPEADTVLRGGVAVSALVQLGRDDPNLRAKVVPLLLELLESDDPDLVAFTASRAATIDTPTVRQAIDEAFDRGAVHEIIVTRENIRSIREENTPWASPRAARDPMRHFSPRNLSYLRSLAEPGTGGGTGQRQRKRGGSSKGRKKGKKAKARRR